MKISLLLAVGCAALASSSAVFAQGSPVNANCPVKGDPIDPTVTLLHQGRLIAFCCENCRADFQAQPNSYVTNLPPVQAEARLRVLLDVPFLGPDRAEKLDIYLPAPSTDGKPRPALVWIHGGGWTGGTKNENRAKNVCGTLADAGYVALSIDYVLGEGAWPNNLHDCKNAVRFLRAHGAKYGVDPARIAVAGGSAGGHLALMVALTGDKPGFEPPAGATPYPGVSSAVRCVANFYGITDLLTRQRVDANGKPTGELIPMASARAFGAGSPAADVLRLASPVIHVGKGSPPILTLHGRIDASVDYQQALELADVARERGVSHELILLEDAGHTFDLQTWRQKPLSRDLRPVLLGFLAKHMGR